jgi:hypothetical protein
MVSEPLEVDYADDMSKLQELYSGQRLTAINVAGNNDYFPAQR